jgi:exosome complex RNA-binding protein Rrp42 (RNase PH superfamily)
MNLTPSGTTHASSVGGALAVVIISILSHHGYTIDAVTAAAIATLCSAGLGYLSRAGRLVSEKKA